MSYFIFATDNSDGADFYASDGTAAGTTDLELSRSNYVPGVDGPDFTNTDGKTRFVGTDGVGLEYRWSRRPRLPERPCDAR